MKLKIWQDARYFILKARSRKGSKQQLSRIWKTERHLTFCWRSQYGRLAGPVISRRGGVHVHCWIVQYNRGEESTKTENGERKVQGKNCSKKLFQSINPCNFNRSLSPYKYSIFHPRHLLMPSIRYLNTKENSCSTRNICTNREKDRGMMTHALSKTPHLAWMIHVNDFADMPKEEQRLKLMFMEIIKRFWYSVWGGPRRPFSLTKNTRERFWSSTMNVLQGRKYATNASTEKRRRNF